jgi:voltage-dependent potassium channel beta subunit
MKYRRLGDAGMKVSAISLGGWINFGEGKVAAERAQAVVERAYERGVNFFDLADIYGKGEAERHMGALLGRYPRHTLVISTKLFWPMSDDINDRGLSRKHIFESIDKSLGRLGTEYVDIYFCHRPDPDTPIEETARAMDDLIRMGKVLYWGTSEWSAGEVSAAHSICERYGWARPKAEQPQYSMLWRERVESELIPATQPRGIGLVVFSPLAMGMLTGKYDDGVPSESRFASEEWARERMQTDDNMARVRRLKPIADSLGISRSQLALAWALRSHAVSSVITGATRPEHVEENVAAAEVVLAESDLAAIERALV